MPGKWTPFPYPSKSFVYAGEALKKRWAELHRGDCEPFPKDAKAREAWRRFHAGDFAGAVQAGLAAGSSGMVAANKAQAIHADSVERHPATQAALFEEVMERARAHAASEPKNANAHYLYAYAAGRYSQRISVARALAQGYGGRIRKALEAALALQPKHAEAQVAMGMYHAEIIDKVGAVVGSLTYGAKREEGERHLRAALALAPDSPIVHIEAANGLVMLHGGSSAAEAGTLRARAAAMKPRDAMEKLDVERAKAALE